MSPAADAKVRASADTKAQGRPAARPSLLFDPTAIPGSEGNPGNVTDRTQQNGPLDWETHDCKQCEKDVAHNWRCYGPQFIECVAECYIYGAGCAETFCPIQSGIATCDDDHPCCGSNTCCGANEVCGDKDQAGSNVDYSLGYCCPKEFPVACGDRTGARCYKAGSTCCGDLETACNPGSVCTNVTGTTATCCSPDHFASDGTCCDHPTVNGVCCGAGENVCGTTCCLGPCVGDQCCFGVNTTVCNGACCTGSCCGNSCCPQGQACTGTGTCCASGQEACGDACCGAGSTCVNAAASQCGMPTVLKFLDGTTGQPTDGNSTCGQAPCQAQYWGSTVTLKGLGFIPFGQITISIPAPSTTPAYTANVDQNGVFVLSFAATGQGTVALPITATESANGTVAQASALATFRQLQ